MAHTHKAATVYHHIEVCRCGASRSSGSTGWEQRAIIARCEYQRQHRHAWALSPVRKDGLVIADDQSPHFDSIRLAADALAVRLYEGSLLEAAS